MKTENSTDMLFCKKCGRFKGHYIYADKVVCCGCKKETKFEVKEK